MKSKAIFLLSIFLFNTLVGFGCALGMEGNHHDENDIYLKSTYHKHQDHEHTHSGEYVHKTIPALGLNFSKEDICCKTLVNDLVTQSKLVPQNGKIQVVLPVIWLPKYAYNLSIPVTSVELGQSFCVDHRYMPPDKDIRIIIQSFQI